MALKPEYSMDEISLEEIFEDLRKITLVYKRAKKHCFPKKSHSIKAKERELNTHLLKNLLPIAKTLSYFKVIHCEPREVYFCDLGENTLGTRSMWLINLNERRYDDLIMFSILTHETVHAFGGLLGESLATLLSYEVDARLALAGHAPHRLSLYKCLRDMVFHVSYLKAKSASQIERWKNFVEELYHKEVTREVIEGEIEHFEKGEKGLFNDLSDYTLLPYLSIKSATKTNITYVIEEYEFFDELKRDKVEIPALIKIWNEVMT
jgi:hypothetical protein